VTWDMSAPSLDVHYLFAMLVYIWLGLGI